MRPTAPRHPVGRSWLPTSGEHKLVAMLAYPIPAPMVVAEDLDDEVCLYRSDIDEVLVLNRTGGDIWRLSDGELSVQQIIERLSAVYTDDSARLSHDVTVVITDLEHRGYLIEADSAMPADS